MLRLFVHIYNDFIKKKKKNDCSMVKKAPGFHFLSEIGENNFFPQPWNSTVVSRQLSLELKLPLYVL